MVLYKKLNRKVSLQTSSYQSASNVRDIKNDLGRYLNMADVNKHEIRTRLLLKHFEKENYYLFVRKDKSDTWSLPSNSVGRLQSIEESAKSISNSVSY